MTTEPQHEAEIADLQEQLARARSELQILALVDDEDRHRPDHKIIKGACIDYRKQQRPWGFWAATTVTAALIVGLTIVLCMWALPSRTLGIAVGVLPFTALMTWFLFQLPETHAYTDCPNRVEQGPLALRYVERTERAIRGQLGNADAKVEKSDCGSCGSTGRSEKSSSGRCWTCDGFGVTYRVNLVNSE